MTIKNIFITVANLDTELVVGKELTYSQLKAIDQKYGEEAVGNYISEKSLLFQAIDIEEIHLYEFHINETLETNCGGYPVLSLDHAGQRIILETAFGSRQENKIVCKSVLVQEF